MNARRAPGSRPNFSATFVNAASVRELEALQAELARLQLEVSPEGQAATLTLAVGMLHRYGSGIVHVDSGRLKNSLFWDVQAGRQRSSALWGTNVQYSIYENARGGEHAFVDRTAREEGPAVERLFGVRISGGKR
jgi:hypothetical protein